MSKFITGTDMKCPHCNSPMVEREIDRFETLCEHVSDPNGEPSIKQSYGCSRPGCLVEAWRWLGDGEGPYHSDFHLKLPQNIPVGTLHDHINKSMKA
jgi:hypothetical protein